MSQNTNAEKAVRFTSPVDNRIDRRTYFEHFGRLGLVALSVLVGCNIVLAQAQAQGKTSSLATGLGKEFASQTATGNGTTLHYVRGGEGPPIILIHGFPQDWFEYRAIMPQLAKRFTVISVDLRGVGGSTATPGGYDAANMADDVYQLASALRLEHVYIVGHDIGGMVTYAFVRRYPQATRGAMILDVPIPGIEGWDEIQGDPSVWHMQFMQIPGLPEKLIAGRQADYFGYFFNFGKFTPSEVAHYVKAYFAPAQLHAAFEMYRAFPANAQFNAAQRGPNDVPLYLAAGAGSPFAKLIPKIAEGLRANGCTHIETGLIPGSGSAGSGGRSDRTICLAAFGMRLERSSRRVGETSCQTLTTISISRRRAATKTA